jgi:hypothetical protein
MMVTASASLTRDIVRACWYDLCGWRGVLVTPAIALGTGVGPNWSWLVAPGIAPAILTALPCPVMCGAGLCVNRLIGAGRSCASQALDRLMIDLAEKEKGR